MGSSASKGFGFGTSSRENNIEKHGKNSKSMYLAPGPGQYSQNDGIGSSSKNGGTFGMSKPSK